MDLNRLASQIGERLLREASRLEDGSLTWHRGSDLERQPARDAGPYNGRCGEALFLAALGAVTGERRFQEESLLALEGLRACAQDDYCAENLARRIGLGNMGLGGILYTLVSISRFLKDPSLLGWAERIAHALTADCIRGNPLLDFQSGIAGALMGTLALVEAGVPGALEPASHCAESLLARREQDPETGLRAWNLRGPLAGGGFAHGITGIGHAIWRYYLQTKEQRFCDAVLEAYAFERMRLREVSLACNWCGGEPGIGFSRLFLLHHLRAEDQPEIIQDLLMAIERTAAYPINNNDSLCCGNLGRADFLLEAGLLLNNPTLISQALYIARVCIQRAESHDFALPPGHHMPTHLRAGFWRGAAGVGYTMLRLSQRAELPCVLLYN